MINNFKCFLFLVVCVTLFSSEEGSELSDKYFYHVPLTRNLRSFLLQKNLFDYGSCEQKKLCYSDDMMVVLSSRRRQALVVPFQYADEQSQGFMKEAVEIAKLLDVNLAYSGFWGVKQLGDMYGFLSFDLPKILEVPVYGDIPFSSRFTHILFLMKHFGENIKKFRYFFDNGWNYAKIFIDHVSLALRGFVSQRYFSFCDKLEISFESVQKDTSSYLVLVVRSCQKVVRILPETNSCVKMYSVLNAINCDHAQGVFKASSLLGICSYRTVGIFADQEDTVREECGYSLEEMLNCVQNVQCKVEGKTSDVLLDAGYWHYKMFLEGESHIEG